MRLICRENDGGLTFAEFEGRNTPQYAILSHTWGSDADEITFREVANQAEAVKTKLGYKKLSFCLDQAARDGLQYVWIDTCCIDKSSSAELSESINSMFRWYQEASKCYVYLSDVSADEFAKNKLSFKNSRWFTRGWTLQELVAPSCVEFFSREGEKLGDKSSLLQELAETTGISVKALQGQPLSDFSIAERMSWAARRETKREEDAAYSLLGIFDVQMPLLYGERQDRAFNRLHRVIQESTEHQPTDPSLLSTAIITSSAAKRQRDQFAPVSTALSSQLADAQQRIFDSLQFSRMQERRHQIFEAHGETYQWILRPKPSQNQHWDDLREWLSHPTHPRRIYWVHGKPGSGKSTLMRFLDENINRHHLEPWAERKSILGAQYFFWNPGAKLQKTLTGLLRALLLQLLEQQPHLIPHVIDQRKWSIALRPGSSSVEWTDTELKNSIYRFVQTTRGSAVNFFLLDGLDEMDGSDDIREELTNFLLKLSSVDNVKICASSRPWNHFRDTFATYPQLRLEDLTRNDIAMYVHERLANNSRFQLLARCDAVNAERLVSHTIERASGVFLWVCLVVRGFLQGLRDGHDMATLLRNLESVPDDIGQYFASLVHSIPPHQRQEASTALQIVLYEEEDFASLHPLSLVDLCFLEEKRPDFILSGQYRAEMFDLTDVQKLNFRLDSTHRKLNSSCMGLIESHFSPLTSHQKDVFFGSRRVLDLNVDFLHRSCKDFLATPDVTKILQAATNGPYDVAMFLLNARIAQFEALAKVMEFRDRAIGLASYILCSLARPAWKNTDVCVTLGAVMCKSIELLLSRNGARPNVLGYISDCASSWHDEQSNFLTLAIDFQLDAYVTRNMTPNCVTTKRGRPILDYILRPRFFDVPTQESVSVPCPSTEILRVALRLGADPNQIYDGASVWAHFLCFLADELMPEADGDEDADFTYALELLLKAGAATLIPRSWLGIPMALKGWREFIHEADPDEKRRFSWRWGDIVPVFGAGEKWYAAGTLLKHLEASRKVKMNTGRLMKLLYHKESRAE